MNQGILYGVGVGPGDPELLTLKAVRILKEADVVAVPDKGSGEKTAGKIVSAFVPEEKMLYCPTPMVRDAQKLDEGYTAIARRICGLLGEGKTVAFITLGDPTVYSTYIYVHRKVLSAGYEARLVPGVPSFCAVAARLNTSLCEGAQRLLIVPASHPSEDCLDVPANKVFMKAGRGLEQLVGQLAQRGQLEQAALVANCGMEGERVVAPLTAGTDGAGYFSIVLVKEG